MVYAPPNDATKDLLGRLVPMGSGPYCDGQHQESYICCRPLNHPGPHVAHSAKHTVVCIWDGKEETQHDTPNV